MYGTIGKHTKVNSLSLHHAQHFETGGKPVYLPLMKVLYKPRDANPAQLHGRGALPKDMTSVACHQYQQEQGSAGDIVTNWNTE